MITVVVISPTSCCPLCSELSSSIHCHYQRTLRDVPCAGRQVQLRLTVRKFCCRNPYCERKVFAERLPDFVEPWARTTIRFCQQITSVGLSTCGKGGANLAARLVIQTSRQTLLRRILAKNKCRSKHAPHNCEQCPAFHAQYAMTFQGDHQCILAPRNQD